MNNWLRRILALITIVGSVYGMTSSVLNIFTLNATGGSFFAMAISALGVLFFLYGLMCGFWLLERSPRAIFANSMFWLAQLPAIVTIFFTYKVYAFGSMAFATDPSFSGFGFPTNGAPMGAPESAFNLGFGDLDAGISLGINLFALFMLVLLFFARGSARTEGSTAKKGGGFGLKRAAKMAGGAAALGGAAAVAGVKGASSVASAAGNVAGSVAGGAVDAAKATASVAGDMAGAATDVAGSLASGVADTAGSVAGGALDAAKATASSAGDMAGAATDVAGSLASGVADTAGAVAGGTLDAAKATASVAGGVAGAATDVAGSVATGVADTAGSLTASAMDTAKEAVAIISGSASDAVDQLDESKKS